METRTARLALIGFVTLCSACLRTAYCEDLANDCQLEVDDTAEPEPEDEPFEVPVAISRDIDILFVIDNSGSMGEEQANLAANIDALIEVLEAEEVAANYRIGITTTDNGNPWCPAGTTTPEAGKLVLSSCKTRLGDFTFNDEPGVQDLACNDICLLDEAQLAIQPTTTVYDPDPKPRPWLERIGGQSNLPAGTSMADAFACFGPQGINGCGFESQLESMYLALLRTQDVNEASYGFIREGASLAVVFVTDEIDCSYNKDYATIFEPDGNRVFWSDPSSTFPTSALCWHAGVECVGDPSNYDTCDPVNKDVNGVSGVSDADAVLHPMSRYLGFLAGLEQAKQELDGRAGVLVTLIAGVDASGQPFYHDVGASDPEFQEDFGIGPGCEAPNPIDPNDPLRALPPVRLRDVSEAFSPGSMFSICEADYSPAFDSVATLLQDQIQPACYDACVQDIDSSTPLLDARCEVVLARSGQGDVALEECLRDASGYVLDAQTNDYTMPSADADLCYALRVDAEGQSADPLDDLADPCVDAGRNLEIWIARRPGFTLSAGSSVTAVCAETGDPNPPC